MSTAFVAPKGRIASGKKSSRKPSAGASRSASGISKTRPGNKKASKKAGSKDISASFNKFKKFNGQLYTGVQIGRGHHWTYDAGDWKETKITPDSVWKKRLGNGSC